MIGSGRLRSALIAALLVAAIAMVGLLAAQAAYAYRVHREVAEGVLRDWSRVAGDEFLRRASTEIGYRGFYATVTALEQRIDDPARLPEPASIEGGALIGELFVVDDVAVEAPYEVRHEAGRMLVYAPLGERAFGFEVEREELERRLGAILAGDSLLPLSDVPNTLLTIRLTDVEGRPLVATGEVDPELAVYRELEGTYSGIFDGMTLVTAVKREAAPMLIIGGLPRSRLPILLWLLAITVGLLIAAIYQLRRERALTRLRAEFVSRVSHELRTPLTQIRMFAETLLLERTRSDAERRRSLEIVDQEARRLSQLVENVLQFSRGDRNGIRLSPEPVELTALIEDVVEKFRPLARARGVRIALDPAEPTRGLVDRDATMQILLNLLDNAVKYGPEGQQVRIGLTRADGRVRLFVEDEGPGVPPRERRRIWRRWRRLERDERAAIAGSGIGLTVVRDLVERHGGRVAIEDGRAGGARFVVELPGAAS